MKTNLFSAFLCATLLFFFTENTAQTKLLHYWHFNNTLPTTGAGGIHFGTGKMNSDYSRAGATTGYLRYVKNPLCVKDTGYWDNNAGDTINQRTGYAGCCPSYSATASNSSIRTRNPSDSMFFLWYVPTTHFKNIRIQFETEASSTSSGQHRMNYDYSLDSGATYMTASLPRLFDSAGTAWGKVTLDLSGITAANNTNRLMLRIRYSAPNSGSSGNNRYDNITVEGDSISTPVSPTGIRLNSNSEGYGLYPNPSNDYIYITAPNSGSKHISITDLMGQVVYSSDVEDKDPVDVSKLNTGIYFVRLEGSAKKTVTLKFVKN